ncbi:MAG: ribosomal-processing cysteine protease Prp [Bacteroides sp.]|nr:ribosomal-processing cysteine protease Prp [Bacteroides sp.]
MVTANFYKKNGLYCGFIVSGHAGGLFGQDIICAGVSSAVMLTINALADFFNCDCLVRINYNTAGLKLEDFENDETGRALIFALKTHLKLLADDYGGINIVVRNI